MASNPAKKTARMDGARDAAQRGRSNLFTITALLTAGNVISLLTTIAAGTVLYAETTRLSGGLLDRELYSHIGLIPVISAYFFYADRASIFTPARSSPVPGLLIAVCGVALYAAVSRLPLFSGKNGPNDYLSLLYLSVFMAWCGGFVISYGTEALKKAAFPVLLLLFMVPLPGLVVEKLVLTLQTGSTLAADALFGLTGVPYTRHGFVFEFQSIFIEVAEECSGIRSTLALFIASLIAGRMCIKEKWKRAALFASVIPLSVFKNGVRIAALSLLGIYVDERALKGPLHNYGGVVFFMLGLALLVPVLLGLARIGKNRTANIGRK